MGLEAQLEQKRAELVYLEQLQEGQSRLCKEGVKEIEGGKAVEIT